VPHGLLGVFLRPSWRVLVAPVNGEPVCQHLFALIKAGHHWVKVVGGTKLDNEPIEVEDWCVVGLRVCLHVCSRVFVGLVRFCSFAHSRG
jgi:hypothetical protein